MHSMLTNKQSSGFTLVEMLIIAPIVILFIGGFVGLLVALTGDSLKRHAQNIMTYETQAALEDIETNAAKATSFLTTTGTLQDKQGKDNTGGTPFTNTTSGAPDTLIFDAPATTANAYSDTRSLVYTGSGTCDSTQPIYTYTSVYFVDSSNTLYKRTILPTSSTPCTTPYQQGSCAASVMASAPPSYCKVEDEKLLDSVTGFSVQYFDADGNSVTATTATSANITVQVSKTVAGDSLSYTGKLTSPAANAKATSLISFAYTGSQQTWVVPTGVTSVTIECWGASGGVYSGLDAGIGGYAKGVLAVTSGQTLNIYVGGSGDSYGVGGWNGGGTGKTSSLRGGGGGGASDVRVGGTALSNRVIVGGGGGGAGGTNPGGVGGGSTGGASSPTYGGFGGTQTAGGASGTTNSVYNGGGTLGQGGAAYPSDTPAAGGGGGGYYGGGGGGGYYGGGGGSGYIGGVTNGILTAGQNNGNGQVKITYQI